MKHYRGFIGNNTVDHNYNWHDAIHSGGGKCGKNTRAPCDDGSHGTHTMGTMLGNTLSEGDNGFPVSGVAIGMSSTEPTELKLKFMRIDLTYVNSNFFKVLLLELNGLDAVI